VNGLDRGCKGQHAFYKLDWGILTLFLFLLFLVMFLRGIKRLSGSNESKDIV
jgi:Na+-transporting methylmalonyl-CoA/oxaloacetate decarboxylase gamma subunit